MVRDGMLEKLVTWAEIDLDAIERNVRSFRRHVGPSVEVMAVVKANAYGHGAIPVAEAALAAGATRLAVHRASEGRELRQAGIAAPVLVMGYTPPDGAGIIVRHRLTPSLITAEFARALSQQATAAGTTVPVHIKVDTGMGRYGVMPAEATEFARFICRLPGLRLEGLFTHFATADAADQTYVRAQLAVFGEVLAGLAAAGVEVPLVHAANSAATMSLPEAHFNAVRPGIAMYGMDPSSEWPPVFALRPALTLKSRVSRVRELPAGAAVSYGRTFVAQQPTRVALVPVGYGDGYHRVLSNKGCVLIHGLRAPILGRVCMDQFVVDISTIPGVEQNDEVVLIGRQGQEEIRAEDLAGLAGTINYEITTSLLPAHRTRIPARWPDRCRRPGGRRRTGGRWSLTINFCSDLGATGQVTVGGLLAFQQKRFRVFDQLLHPHQELHGLAAVHDAVIVAESDVHHRPDHHLPVLRDGPFLDLVHAEDADLGRVDDGRAEQRAEDAAVGDGEGAATQILQRQRSVLHFGRIFLDRPLDFGKRHALCIAQHRHNQTLGGSDGDADIVITLQQDLIALDLRIEAREALQCADRRPDKERHEAQADAVPFLERVPAAFADIHHRGHVDFVEGREHGRGVLGFDQAPGDRLPAARHADMRSSPRAAAAWGKGSGGRGFPGL